MIPQIKEINFPNYATLSSATVSLNDMGEKTISAQVKIDGRYEPDFSEDWEVEFQGERYIQPLREPQASKGNDSLCSVIDLTFQHKTIYELKRYYFVQMAPLESGTAVVDKYIASLGLNLGKFIEAFKEVIAHWFPNNEITVDFNEKWEYDEAPSFIEISYSHIWDVLTQLYDVYGVRWTIEKNVIRIGYETENIDHIFKYGYEGGLIRVERQVQNAQLANSLLGRGGDTNLPYRYFKDVDKENPSFKADPDWIPELANISFGNLRGKTFRDYIKGWKAQRYGGEPMAEPTEEYLRGYADSEKSTDTKSFFDPIEYVEDKESIKKYNLLQNGLENAEDIFPTIQGVEVEGLGRVDEVVDVEEVKFDARDFAPETTHNWADTSVTKTFTVTEKGTQTFKLVSEPFSIGVGMIGSLYDYLTTATMMANGTATFHDYVGGLEYNSTIADKSNIPIQCKLKSVHFFNADTKEELSRLDNLTAGFSVFFEAEVENINAAFRFDDGSYSTTEAVTGIDPNTGWPFSTFVDVTHNTWWEMEPDFELTVDVRAPLYQIQFGGQIIDNNIDNKPITSEKEIASKGEGKLIINASDLIIKEGNASMVDIPIKVDAYEKNNSDNSLRGQVEYKKTIILSNKETGEQVTPINIPEGEYSCRVEVECYNNSGTTAVFKVTLLPTYLFPPAGESKWLPTFNVWVKNIWGSVRNNDESDESYAKRVWDPILGDRESNTAKVVFSTGNLSGHSDYEFGIHEVHFDNTAVLGEVQSEWRLTLVKSDAELEATGLYIPNSQTGGNAAAGDKFYFIGIDMPHQYVLWAEERLDQYKRDQLLETANIKPTWVVQTDKVRLNESRDGKKLLDSFKIGNTLTLKDDRFLKDGEKLYLQSITYTWDTQTALYPSVEVVLSDKYEVSANPVAKLQGDVDVLSKQVGSISNIQQIIRAVGDKLYLRRDGFEAESNSPTIFKQQVNSGKFVQGPVGGKGWGLREEQGRGIIECDKLIVRDEMQVNSLVVNQISTIGGREILSAAAIECSKVEVLKQGFKCYFDQKQGSVANNFVVGDFAYSQVFNQHNTTVKYYKRLVIEVGDNYIMLSTQSNGDGAPQEGDVIVQYGNIDNPDRQFVIIRDVVGGGYERMLCGLDDIDSEGIEYFFAGRMDGGAPRWFVGDANQYVKFEDGKIALECKQVGMTSEGSSDDTVRIWAGADNDSKDSAPFRVRQDGKVFASNAEFEGNVIIKGSSRCPFDKYYESSSMDNPDDYWISEHTDNIVSSLSPNTRIQMKLPWDIENGDGRKITIIGGANIIAPSTQDVYFFENGRRSKIFSSMNEIVELVGFSVEKNESDWDSERIFKGWVVTHRSKFRVTGGGPQEGLQMDPVLVGRIKCSTTNPTLEVKHAFGTKPNLSYSIDKNGAPTGTYSVENNLGLGLDTLSIQCSLNYSADPTGSYPITAICIKDYENNRFTFKAFSASGQVNAGIIEFMVYHTNF